jgi:hypothetical protein
VDRTANLLLLPYTDIADASVAFAGCCFQHRVQCARGQQDTLSRTATCLRLWLVDRAAGQLLLNYIANAALCCWVECARG